MKKLLFLAIVLISMVSMNCSAPQEETVQIASADKELTLEVEGMVCATGCAKFIEKQVAKMDGVADCTVNFEDGIAKISYSSKVTGQEDILETITGINDGQYKVTVVKLSSEKSESSSAPKSEGEEVNETEVSFYFPELVTYFMSRIIR